MSCLRIRTRPGKPAMLLARRSRSLLTKLAATREPMSIAHSIVTHTLPTSPACPWGSWRISPASWFLPPTSAPSSLRFLPAFRSGPYLTAAACQHLVHAGAVLVGIDCANIDNMKDPARPAHTILLAAGIPIVEHLRGLGQLAGTRFRFFAVPPAIEGGTSFPVRAMAVCE